MKESRSPSPRRVVRSDALADEEDHLAGYLAFILDAIPNPVFVKDDRHRIVAFNEAFCAMLGRSRAELIGKSDFDLVPAEEARLYWEKDDAVFRSGQPHENEEALTDATGTRHWLVTRKSIVDLPNGRRYLVGVISDITARKRAEERLTDAIEILSQGFVLFDEADRLVLCNTTYRQHLGGVADLLVPGVRGEDLLRAAVERGLIRSAAGDAEAWLTRRLALRRQAGGSFEQELADGRWLRVIERRTADGGLVSIGVDITESKTRERELNRAKEAAETADCAKSEFLANMSHELRTPLNAVIGFAELLALGAAGALNPKQSAYVDDIRGSGLHLLHLINEILDLSKIDAGGLALREEAVRVDELVDVCARLLKVRAAEGGVRLEVACVPDLPLVLVDPVRLKQILINLLSNGVKFTPAGGRVSLTVAGTAAGVVFTVIDTGIGMRAEEIPVALEPFRQIDGALTRRYEGTGLGLPLAKRLTELHGGTLQLTSEPEKGTRVVVTLPKQRLLGPASVSAASNSRT